MAGRFVVVALVAVALASPAAASASALIDRNAFEVRLAVNEGGEALVTYRAGGRERRVLASGAIDALAPTPGALQVRFTLDYSGRPRRFRNRCAPYDGPALAWLVTACRAPDGSLWAVQSWQRTLPNHGMPPTAEQASWELRLSHWSWPLPVLELLPGSPRWGFPRLTGRLTYAGRAVHGYSSTPTGVPLDGFGRNVYLDTLNAAYGPGWHRENAFLTQVGSGAFCYGLVPRGVRPSGTGERYRATAIGPGVLPDVVAYSEPGAPAEQTFCAA